MSVVVGNGAGGDQNEIAQPVTIEERSTAGELLRSIPLRTTSTPGRPACTLLSAGTPPGWMYQYDGLLSRSGNGQLAMVLCYDRSVGQSITMGDGGDVPADSKVIALLYANGTVVYSAPIAYTFEGAYNKGGAFTVASVDGSEFWLSGNGETLGGFRYLASLRDGGTSGILGEGPSDPGFFEPRGCECPVPSINGRLPLH